MNSRAQQMKRKQHLRTNKAREVALGLYLERLFEEKQREGNAKVVELNVGIN